MELNPYQAPDADLVAAPRAVGPHEVDSELFPAYRSWSIANTIGRLRYSRAPWELHAVLDGQRRFFTFMGASLVLLVVGYGLMVVLAIARAALGRSG